MSIFDDFDNWNPRATTRTQSTTPPPLSVERRVFNAASRGQHSQLSSLFEVHPVIDLLQLFNGFNALHIAAKKGYVEITLLLLGRDSSLLTSRLADGRDAFMLAAFEGHLSMLKALNTFIFNSLEASKMEAVDQSGNTCLHYAAWGGSLDCVEYLVTECGKNVNALNNDNIPALQFAAAGNHANVVQFLSKRQVEDNSLTGMTTLHRASVHGSLDTVRFLIEEQHYNPNAVNESGHSTLHFACKHGHEEIVHFLCSLPGIAVNLQSEFGLTPLHFACISGHSSIVRELMSHGADAKLTNRSNENALHFAAAAGNHEICQILRKFCARDVFNADAEGGEMCRHHYFDDELTVAGKTPVDKALDSGFKELANSLVFWSCIETKAQELRSILHV